MARVVRLSDLRNVHQMPVVVWPPAKEHPTFNIQHPMLSDRRSQTAATSDDAMFVMGQVRGVLNLERGGQLNKSKALKRLEEIMSGFEKGLHE